MDIQKIKDRLMEIEGYRGCLLWLLQELEKEAAKQNEEKKETQKEVI